MTHITLGHAERKPLYLDLPILLRTRLLIQANSGGGKSYALRRILEQAFGKVQCIVIDPAGEFSTLREKYDFILIGEHGEAQVDIRSAGLLATRLLELRAPAIIDLYSLKPAERHIWVQRYFEATMNAPKSLWHPVLFIVDEAHKFMPEKGEGESVAKPAMLSVCSDGRKYGFCMIAATQRLAKLDKSGAAELLNVLIGPTFIDVDLMRAHKALGILPGDYAAFDEQMKTVEPGNFYALGRAVSKKRVLIQIGPVETTHPEAGQIEASIVSPPTPEKIKALLPKLADLPKEAEQKARTEAEMRQEIAELKRQITARPPVVAPRPEIQHIEIPIFKDGEVSRLEAVSQTLSQVGSQLVTVGGQLTAAAQEVTGALRAVVNRHTQVIVSVPIQAPTRAPITSAWAPNNLPAGEKAILSAAAQYPDGVTREQLTILTGYKRSSRDTYLQRLKARGCIEDRGKTILPTPEGIAALGSDYEPLPVGEALRNYWLARLPRGEREIFAIVIANYPNAIQKSALEETTNYKRSSRDTYIQRLRARMLIKDERGAIRANESLFE